MLGDNANMAVSCCEESPVERPSIMQDLVMKKARLEKEIAEVDFTIELFTKHPEMEQCLTQLSKVGIYR